MKSLFVLIAGTGIAQLISIGTSPIFTRIFSPEEFGIFSSFIGMVSILSTVVNGRYDLAIIESKNINFAKRLVQVSVGITLILTFFFLLFFLISTFFFISIYEFKYKILFFSLFPIALISTSLISIILNWLNRDGNYNYMSKIRIFSAISTNSLILFFGYILNIDYALIFGYVFGLIFVLIFFFPQIKFIFDYLKFRNVKIFFEVIKRYSRYPKYLILATLASEISGTLPLLIIGNFFSLEYAGFFALAVRVTTVPLTFIGNAIGEVYRQKAALQYREVGNCYKLYILTLITLLFFGFLGSFLIFITAHIFIPLIFGENWIVSAEIIKYLSFLIFFQFFSSPLSYTITFNNSQKWDLLLQVFRALFSMIALYIGFLHSDFFLGLRLYVITYCIYYLGHTFIQYKASKGTYSIIKGLSV